jgi:hypothetical protein
MVINIFKENVRTQQFCCIFLKKSKKYPYYSWEQKLIARNIFTVTEGITSNFVNASELMIIYS